LTRLWSQWYKDSFFLLVGYPGGSRSVVTQPIDRLKILFERRSRRRFPLQLALEYRLLGKRERYGFGRTCNISSAGVFFEIADQQPLAGSIELLVSWPCVLDGACALKLKMKGRVVRTEGRRVAIESCEHEFRTAGPASGAKHMNLKMLMTQS
jgi:PilZ domain